MSAPKTLRELVERYKQKKISFDKQHEMLDNKKEIDTFIGTSIFNHLAFNVFISVMAIISILIILVVIKLIFKGRENANVIGKFGNDKRSKSNNRGN